MRAIVVCKGIGPASVPALMSVHKQTQSSSMRSYSCTALQKFKSPCPAGTR